MSSDKHEKLSALIDNEATRFEARGLVKDMLKDHQTLDRWERYHLIRATLRGELPPTLDLKFTGSLMARLQGESDGGVAGSAGGWFRPMAGGLAIAASLAVVSVFAFKSFTDSTLSTTAGTTSISATSEGATPERSLAALEPTVPAPDAIIAATQSPPGGVIPYQQLRYLITHSEYAPAQGMSPYVRLMADMSPE